MVEIQQVTSDQFDGVVAALAVVTHDVVDAGASVGFMAPFSIERAMAYWEGLRPGIDAGTWLLFVARIDGRILGTVSVVLVATENQPHRFEIAKMQVHRDARRQGVAAALLATAETAARAHGRDVGVLDTVSGSDAERLYRSAGWIEVGQVPEFALYPDGTRCPTTMFYKHLGTTS
jgi:GNAT superfamily N-acetyltransferase